jgi:hypothetical protein
VEDVSVNDPLALQVNAAHLGPADPSMMILLAGAFAAVAAAVLWYELRYRRREPKAPMSDEWRARAVMQEMCPAGWRARISLHGSESSDRESGEAVHLEWAELRPRLQGGDVAVERRLSAPTIGAALEAMVRDRRTDAALEEIEQSAARPRSPSGSAGDGAD